MSKVKSKPGKRAAPQAVRWGVRYPWAKWFKLATGRYVLLARGVDYQCSDRGMQRNIDQAKKRLGLQVTTKVDPQGIIISVVGEKRWKLRRA